jgi:hypothetical protein
MRRKHGLKEGREKVCALNRRTGSLLVRSSSPASHRRAGGSFHSRIARSFRSLFLGIDVMGALLTEYMGTLRYF